MIHTMLTSTLRGIGSVLLSTALGGCASQQLLDSTRHTTAGPMSPLAAEPSPQTKRLPGATGRFSLSGGGLSAPVNGRFELAPRQALDPIDRILLLDSLGVARGGLIREPASGLGWRLLNGEGEAVPEGDVLMNAQNQLGLNGPQFVGLLRLLDEQLASARQAGLESDRQRRLLVRETLSARGPLRLRLVIDAATDPLPSEAHEPAGLSQR